MSLRVQPLHSFPDEPQVPVSVRSGVKALEGKPHVLDPDVAPLLSIVTALPTVRVSSIGLTSAKPTVQPLRSLRRPLR